MSEDFDPRIIAPATLSLLQACQRVTSFHLGGGAPLAGLHLRHRLSADVDLFVHDRDAHRDLVGALPEIGTANATPVSLVHDAGTFVRGQVALGVCGTIEIDVIFDPTSDLEPPTRSVQCVTVDR